VREANAYVSRQLNVMEIEGDGGLRWIDPAGYIVARGPKPREWPQNLEPYYFQLDVANSVVQGAPYQPHTRRMAR